MWFYLLLRVCVFSGRDGGGMGEGVESKRGENIIHSVLSYEAFQGQGPQWEQREVNASMANGISTPEDGHKTTENI